MEKEQILGFNVSTYASEILLKEIFKDYLKNEQLFIVNINPEIAVSNFKNEEFRNILNKQKYQMIVCLYYLLYLALLCYILSSLFDHKPQSIYLCLYF